jgi:hypothetical protein
MTPRILFATFIDFNRPATLHDKVDGCSANSYIATHIPLRISDSR